MIIRVFRPRIFPDKINEFERFLHEIAVPMVRAQKGMVSVMLGKPLEPGNHDFLVITIWESLEALKAFTGKAWNNPVLDPAEDGLLMETFLDHFSLIEEV